MPALPYPTYGIYNLYLYPHYQTREEYEKATGRPAPPWNPNKPPKGWIDVKAGESPRRNIVYDRVLAIGESGAPIPGPDGKPLIEALLLSKDEAANVNIPPKGPTHANIPGTEVSEIPVPLRPLEPNEELTFGFGGGVVVRNRDFQMQTETPFNQRDRALLEAIASKVGVQV